MLVSLNCVVVEDGELVVELDDGELVGFLKNKIKEMQRYDCAVGKLKLFVAKINSAWMTVADARAVSLSLDSHPVWLDEQKYRHDFVQMETFVPISDESYFGVSFEPRPREVHVLVVLPGPTEDFVPNKRLCWGNTGKLEVVPRIDIRQDLNYVTLPAAFLEKCGLQSNRDLMLYCRPQVHALWSFLNDEVVANYTKGIIVGPPGIGKSVRTLSFALSLNRQEWDITWIHLGKSFHSFMNISTKEYGIITNILTFTLPEAGKKRFVFLDGFKNISQYEVLSSDIFGQLEVKKGEKFVVCSSMATLGKRKLHEDLLAKVKTFVMYSWTQSEYLAAITDQTFYTSVVDKLDATNACEVNDDRSDLEQLSDEETKHQAIALKFYYAGGSCRFMFQYSTEKVISILIKQLHSLSGTADLIKYCYQSAHPYTSPIHQLYGMYKDGHYSGRFPVSSYVTYLFANESGAAVIAGAAERLERSENPSVVGHLFEWLFLASVRQREVGLLGNGGVENILPQANIDRFNPKKRLNMLADGSIRGDRNWLQPIAQYQGSYDAVYFDVEKRKVIFIQFTRSDMHDFKIRYFHEVLFKLRQTGMDILDVVVYFVVTPSQYLKFKGDAEHCYRFREFDTNWIGPEEVHVKLRAFEAIQLN